MSVPGQSLFGTFVVQPADSGREFIHIRAAVEGNQKTFSSETVPVGARVARLFYRGRAVRDGDTFTICLNSYRASGTGGYDFYRDCPVVKEVQTEMSDLILAYFRTHPDTAIWRRSVFSVVGGAPGRQL